MVKIAICDDEAQELERTYNFLLRYKQRRPQYDIEIVPFSAPLELISYVEKYGSFHIFILDVYMTGMLGTDAARELRQLDDKGEIIFITSSRDHAIDAYEVDAAKYLVKPYTKSVLFSAMDKVLSRLIDGRHHAVTLKTTEGFVRLFTREIVFTETGRKNYQAIHTIKGNVVEVRMTASELFELLVPAKIIVRCGSSMILNLKYIRQIRKDAVILDSGEELAYPYRAYKKLKEQFLCFQMSTDE